MNYGCDHCMNPTFIDQPGPCNWAFLARGNGADLIEFLYNL